MGGNQTVQPLFGEEGVGPAVEVPPLGHAPTFAPFAEDRPQPLADPPVQRGEHERPAVLEVREPAPKDAIDVGDDAAQGFARVAPRLRPQGCSQLLEALRASPVADAVPGALEVIAQEVEALTVGEVGFVIAGPEKTG